jgi:DNA-binding protein YbaB
MSDGMQWLDQDAAESGFRLRRLREIQAEVGSMEASGSSPNGFVTATMTGKGKLKSVVITAEGVNRVNAANLLGQEVVAAVAAAVAAMTALSRERMAEVVDPAAIDAAIATYFGD